MLDLDVITRNRVNCWARDLSRKNPDSAETLGLIAELDEFRGA